MTIRQGDLITKKEIRDFYERLAPDLDRYRNKNAYYYELLGHLLRFLIPEGQRVLDIGCGQGDFLDLLHPSQGVGIDLSPAMIERAKEKYPHLSFAVGDAEELDLDAPSFDYILLSNIIGYLQDIQRAFARLRDCCTPDTRVVITHYNYLWEPVLKLGERLGMKVREPYQNWLSISDIENLLSLEGFEVVRKRQAVLFPKRLPIISFLFNRYLAQLPFLWRLSLVQIVVARSIMPGRRSVNASCTVVIPVRNERGNIESIVRRIPEMGRHTEIIFIEGHSSDGTLEEIRRVAAARPGRDIKVLKQDGEGKADAVRKGFEHACGDILMILDADLSVQPEELPKFFEAVVSGRAELAIGSRLVYPLQKDSMRLLNLAGNKFFSAAFTYLLEQRIKDTLCGTKALLRKNYLTIARNRPCFGEFDPFGDFDLLFGAAKANLRIAEIPVRYQARIYGTTQIKRFRHGLLLVKMICTAIKRLKFTG